MFIELMIKVVKLIKDGSVRSTGLSSRHPLVLFARDPDHAESALRLDDTVIWGSLPLLVEARDPCVSEAARRILGRQLFKAVDVREKVRIELGIEASIDERDSRRVDLVCDNIQKRVRAKITDLRRRIGNGLVPMMSDSDVREPYRRYQESKGPLNQIRIKLPGGGLVDLGERSRIVRSIESFKLDRIYLAERVGESQEFVHRVIKEEVGNAKAL